MQILSFRLFALMIGLALSSPGFAQHSMVQVAKFSIEQGLSDRTVSTITKDKQSFLWIGTAQGLNRFDGYDFLTYNSRPRDKHQIRYNKIYAVLQDRAGNLLISYGDPEQRKLDLLTGRITPWFVCPCQIIL